MSTTLPPSPPTPNHPNSPTGPNYSDRRGQRPGGKIASRSASESAALIENRIREASGALWRAELTRRVLGCGMIIASLWWAWVMIDHAWPNPPHLLRWLMAASTFATSLGLAIWRIGPLFRRRVPDDYAARAFEQDHPEWRGAVSSYWELRGRTEESSLDGRVVRNLGISVADRLEEDPQLPSEATGTLKYWIAAIAMLCGTLLYGLISPKSVVQSTARLMLPLATIEAPRRVDISEVRPGDSTARAGRAVLFAATIEGLDDDEHASCRVYLGDTPVTIPLPPAEDVDTLSGWNADIFSNGDTAEFSELSRLDQYAAPFTLPVSASGSVRYEVVAGDAVSPMYSLAIEDLPVVTLQSVTVAPPAYTRQPPFVTRSGAITAIDGSRVQILASVNRRVTKARLEFNPELVGQEVQATAGAMDVIIDDSGRSLSAEFSLRGASRRKASVATKAYQIRVWDETDATNPEPIVYPIRIVEDLPPEISIAVPRQTPKEVSIDAQQVIEVHASDPDFGLTEVILEMKSGLRRIKPPTLFLDAKGKRGNQIMIYRFRPSELVGGGDFDCRVGDVVEITAVAIDNRHVENDPTMQRNRTSTDPIEFRIVASRDDVADEDPEGDGMSKVDDQPTTSGDQGSQGGEQTGGGGGGGDGDAQASESQDGQGETPGGQGGAEGQERSDSQPPDSSDSTGQSDNETSGTDNNASQNSGGGNGDSSSDTGSSEGNAMTDPSQDQSSTANDPGAANAPGSTGESNSTGKPDSMGNQGSPNDTRSNDQQEQSADADPAAGESSTNNAPNQNDPNAEGSSSNAGNQSAPSTERDPGESSGENSTGGSSERGQQGNPKEQPPNAPESPPEHDGEAFERIKDYLEEKEKQAGSSSDRGNAGSEESQNGESSSGKSDVPNDSQGESATGKDSPSTGDSVEQPKSEDSMSDPDSGSTGDDGSGSDNGSGSSGTADAENTAPSPPKSTNSNSQDDANAGETGESGKDNAEAGSPDSGETNRKGEPSKSDPTDTGNNAENGNSPSSNDSSQNGSDAVSPDGSASSSSSADSDSSGDSPSSDSGSDDSGSASSSSGDSASETGSDSQSGSDSTMPGGSSADGSGETQPPGGIPLDAAQDGPEPINEDYAKEATDLVLDYLEKTGDQPDPELLDRLKWSPDDLKRFQQRWQDLRKSPSSSESGDSSSLSEALQSLGLRPPTSTQQSERGIGDALDGIRDGGSRTPPPPGYRDAFDAFRRAMGRREESSSRP